MKTLFLHAGVSAGAEIYRKAMADGTTGEMLVMVDGVLQDTKGVEVKREESVKLGILDGYASTKDLDEVGDIVRPSAFVDTLAEFDEFPNLLFNHDWGRPIGRIAKATITDNGLKVRAELNLDTTDGANTYALVKQGALRGMSIGYIPEVITHDDELGIDTLEKVRLFEISVVGLPANRAATFELGKQLKAWHTAQEDLVSTRTAPLDTEEQERGGHKELDDEELLRLVAGAGALVAGSATVVAKSLD